MPKILIAIGIILVITGLFWPWIKKLGFGQLPGDIVIRKGNFVFYFPITTCIIISLIVMIIWWLLNR
ncbi:DUF2905 domain-containing protein [Legionella jamestowniensis]|uniref:DUF2905 domain-containing protein n=1 Tax=Legionella jamestowniensis TaxID=455 RepID=A0A0W0UZJ8_9GAMM|nr:DUF2905 domain-containing protein [Legionella jamestowniensis]KTD13266.1 hypothetical protein Ljam_0056 [Legionella jamestowniensis]SFL77885.1 Protein of unknown function [Legionella jamestowniensis DSM 19215]